MRIVDHATFLALPNGTLFAKYEPCVFGPLCIKRDTTPTGDFWETDIASAIVQTSSSDWSYNLDSMVFGASVPVDLNQCVRDGLHEQGQLFAVWEHDDIVQLCNTLLASSTAPR